MKKVWAILIWGVLIFGIGTYLDMVRGMLMAGSDPMITAVFRFAVGLVLVVVVVLVGRWLRRWTGKGLGPGEWFVAGAVAWVIQGGYMWQVEPGRTLDLVVHDTFLIIFYVYAAAVVAVVFGVIGLIYLTYPMVMGRALNRIMGCLHFWVSIGALYVVLWMESYKYVSVTEGSWGFGMWGVRNWQTSQVVGWAYTGLAILFVAVQVVFGGNLVASLFWRRRRLRRS
jgi:heme/copper-type cytochrome/quinol oxidase subunit 1